MADLSLFDKEVLGKAYKARVSELKREIEELYKRASDLGIDLDEPTVNVLSYSIQAKKDYSSDNFVLTKSVLELLEESENKLSAMEVRTRLRERYSIVEERFNKDKEALRKSISSALVNLIKKHSHLKREKIDDIYHYYSNSQRSRTPSLSEKS